MIVASAETAKDAAEPPNLTDRQIRVYLGSAQAREIIPEDAAQRADRLGAGVAQVAAQVEPAAVIPLRAAFQPGTTAMVFEGGGARGFPPVDLARRHPGPRYDRAAQLYVATPAVLRYLGIDPAAVASGTDFLADRSVPANQLVIPSFAARREFPVANVQRIDVGRHLFGSDGVVRGHNVAFITLDGLRRRGWMQMPAGWLVEARRPLTSEQIADARKRAAEAGLTLEVKRQTSEPATAMAITTAAGALLALGILALTVGLIRGESASDLRTLTATGATTRIRRTLTATTAGSLALLGAVLGVAGAYVLLLALYYDDLGYLGDVPVLYLALALVGVPLAATAAGWLLSGREPPAIARTILE